MDVFLFFLLLSSCTAVAQQRQLNISSGSSLSPTKNSSWLSPSGLYAFGFYQQGEGYGVGIFIARIPQRIVVWTANRDNPTFPSNSTLLLSNDGRLILQGVNGQDIPLASPTGSIAAAAMLDSGNFVLYNSEQNIIWQSFENPTNTLLPLQRLSTKQELISSASETDDSKGLFRLKMQTDGNLVQYPVETADSPNNAYWGTGTSGGDVSLNLDIDGHLYLLDSINIIYNITNGSYPTQRRIYVMKIDADGILRLYSYSLDQGNLSTIWQSSGNKCAPKGLCGPNSFCIQTGAEAECRCPPGFDFVNQGKRSLGCERNFTAGSCKYSSGSVKYIINPVSIKWEDDPYTIFNTTTYEDCGKACLEDCNCEAAFFEEGKCKKQKFPLRFGRTSTDSSTVFIKTAGAASSSPGIPSDLPRKCKKQIRMDILIISISVLILASLMLVISGVLIHRNKKTSGNRNIQLIENVAPRVFTYAELQQATKDFKEELGRGAFGTVYKGVLPDCQKVVAVKKLEKILADGEREFQTEIRVIGRTHHRNLVRLLGYCLDGPQRLLVYEYMSSGSLEKILFNPENWPNWEERIGIASDVGRGILYLHEECETQIIHCDIKPQNILLDEHWCAKISDFGLAKLLKHDQTRTYTGIRGTKGYVAPEWHRRLPVTVKPDVYSFGILLLEIVCRRKSVDWSLPEQEAILDEWAYTCFEAGELHKLVEDEEVDRQKLGRMIKIGLWCTQDEPSLRPSMRKVLLMLEGTVDIPPPPSPT